MSVKIIKNGMVYQSVSGEFKQSTIVIEGEKIQSILPTEANAPNLTDVEVIDGTGLYITPGLIDTSSQIGLKETGVRWEGDDSYEPDYEEAYALNVTDGIYPLDPSFKDALSSGVTAVHMMSSPNNVIGGSTAVIHTDGVTIDEMVINDHLGYAFSMGNVPKEAYYERKKMPITRMGIAHKIRKSLQALQSAGKVLNERPIFIRCHRFDDIDTALRIGNEFNIKPILVHATQYDAKRHQQTLATNQFIVGPCFQAIERNELIGLSPDLYKKMSDHHLTFSFATDHPTSSVELLRLEAILALKSGVSEAVILNSLTVEAAKLLQIDHLTGNMKEDLYADVVIWDKHPLHYMAKVKKTFIKGKEVYKESERNA